MLAVLNGMLLMADTSVTRILVTLILWPCNSVILLLRRTCGLCGAYWLCTCVLVRLFLSGKLTFSMTFLGVVVVTLQHGVYSSMHCSCLVNLVGQVVCSKGVACHQQFLWWDRDMRYIILTISYRESVSVNWIWGTKLISFKPGIKTWTIYVAGSHFCHWTTDCC